MIHLDRGAGRGRTIIERAPRLSLALPALLAAILGLLVARAALELSREGNSSAERAAGAASPQESGGAELCLPADGLLPDGTRPALDTGGSRRRPSFSPSADPSILPSSTADLLASAPGWPGIERRGPPPRDGISPSAPCSQRAPPPPAAPPGGGKSAA